MTVTGLKAKTGPLRIANHEDVGGSTWRRPFLSPTPSHTPLWITPTRPSGALLRWSHWREQAEDRPRVRVQAWKEGWRTATRCMRGFRRGSSKLVVAAGDGDSGGVPGQGDIDLTGRLMSIVRACHIKWQEGEQGRPCEGNVHPGLKGTRNNRIYQRMLWSFFSYNTYIANNLYVWQLAQYKT